MRRISLKTKLVLYSLGIFITLVPPTAYLSINYFREKFQKSIETQQYLLVKQVASELDDKISFTQIALIQAAKKITQKQIKDPFEAQHFLQNRYVLLTIFDNGIFLFTPSGALISEAPNTPPRHGLDLSFRDYIKLTGTTGRPCVSAPYTATEEGHHPAIMFTAPVLDKRGKLLAIMGGSIDILKPNFVGELSNAKIGNSGYFYITTTNRIIVVHPEKKMIQVSVPAGLSSPYDMAIKGFEGSGESKSVRGIPLLTSFKRLDTINWILVANYPVAEAFAPVKNAALTAWIIVAVGAVITAVIFWVVMGRLISPLRGVTLQIREGIADPSHAHRVPISSNDEIGDLAEAFNGLMSQLSNREEELRRLNVELEHRVIERTAQLESANTALLREIEQRTEAQEEISWLNDDLQKQKIALETTNRELRAFSYSVSHDLRAPLRHIAGFVRILKDDYGEKLDGQGLECINRVVKASLKMEELIEALLKLSRVSQSELNVTTTDLSSISRDISNSLQASMPERNVTFSQAEGIVVQADPSLMRVVMENLLGNAWKYTSKNQSAVIEFGEEEQNGHPVYYVRDNGAGFDPAYAGDLFAPFRRLHGVDEYEGTGIGLATVQRIIHRHGGKIWAEGSVGEGAAFFFTLHRNGSSWH